MTNQKDKILQISADSIGDLITICAELARLNLEDRQLAMDVARAFYAALRINNIEAQFEWADPDFVWEQKGYCALKSVTIAGNKYEVM